jgi:hypothetical protein
MVLSPPNQATYTVGQVLSSARMNSDVRDSVNFLANVPLLACSQTSGQVLTTGVVAPVALDFNSIDTYSGHSTVTNNSRYVAQVAGWYWVRGKVAFPPSTVGRRFVTLAVNGVENTQARVEVGPMADATGATSQDVLVQLQVSLPVTSYVEMWAFQASGASLTLVTGANDRSVFECRWVHIR